MRFFAFHMIDERTATMPSPAEMAEMGKLMQEMTEAGVLVATAGLMPTATGARIRYSDGERIVTDGPFIESKEVLAGYAIIEAASLEEAMGWSSRFGRLVGDATLEVRQMYEEGDPVCVDLVNAGDAVEGEAR